MSISRRPCGVRPLCRECLTRWRLRDVWYRSHQSVHGRKFKENTCPYGMVGMCRHRLTPTTQRLGLTARPLDCYFFLLYVEEAGFPFYLCVSHASRKPLCILVLSSWGRSVTVPRSRVLFVFYRSLFTFLSSKIKVVISFCHWEINNLGIF